MSQYIVPAEPVEVGSTSVISLLREFWRFTVSRQSPAAQAPTMSSNDDKLGQSPRVDYTEYFPWLPM